ncbi:hypothetical protein CEP53_011267 [Fusarium sp. AF-6]|nr:hypothetical protein CEP53_011267 [Fusarium sp. AF-6]
MAINKKAGLSIVRRVLTGLSDSIELTPDYTLRKAQVECISKHGTCERTTVEAHNRGLAPHLGQRSLLQLAQLATQVWGQGSISTTSQQKPTSRSFLLTTLCSKERLF